MVELNQEFDQVREKFERLLKIDPNQRNEDNLFELMRLTSNLKIFESIKMTNMHKEICKSIYTKPFERGEIIFKQGDDGDAYYFVLRGGVDLYMYDVDQFEGKTKLKLLATILSGGGFGELALLYDCPRTATAVANTKSELIVFKKKLYTKYVKDLHEKELYDLIQFFYSIPIFKDEPLSNILKICLRTQRKTINSYEIFLRTGEYLNDFCFVKCGVVKAFVKIKFDPIILKNIQKISKEKFVSSVIECQNNSLLRNEEVIDIMEFTDKDMFCEYYAIKELKLDVFIMPTLPSQILYINKADFKKINPNLTGLIEKFAIPIYDSERILTKLYDNIIWKNSKKKLLYNAFNKKN